LNIEQHNVGAKPPRGHDRIMTVDSLTDHRKPPASNNLRALARKEG
jgi:hypothetical protein